MPIIHSQGVPVSSQMMNGNPVEHMERENRVPFSWDLVNKTTAEIESYKLGQNKLFKHVIP